MAKKAIQEDYEKSLNQSFMLWDSLRKYGGQDPFWSDGCDMNLVRNHIINYKRIITETMPQEQYPEIFYRETPPEVNQDYMARESEIRINARASLERLKASPDYRYLCRHVNSVSPKDNISWPVKSVKGLEKAIVDDDLVTMRRYENQNYELEMIASTAKRLRELPRQDQQLSLFDYCDENAEDDEMEW